MRQESALNVDAPVTLDELLDRTARETLVGGARDLGVDCAVVDRDGQLVAGEMPARELLEARPDLDPVLVPKDGRTYAVLPLLHEGGTIGMLSLGPFTDEDQARRLANHFLRVVEAFIVEGIKRAISAR